MVNINLLLNSMPDGVWPTIIGWFTAFISSYGWAILVFTICLKLVLSPLDIWQKVSSRKNAEKQAAIQPEIQKVQARYGNNKELLNKKTMEVYKKNGYNIGGSCIGMLISLVVTSTIFITLLGSMTTISEFKIKEEYETLENTYDINLTLGEDVAQEAVLEKYDEIKESFLWVENMWRPDSNASVFPSFEEYLTISGTADDYEDGDAGKAQKEADKAKYELVTAKINEKYDGWNGYYILIALASLSTFASIKLGQKSFYRKKKTAKPAAGPNMNIMGIVLAVMMIFFTIGSSSAFALYLVVSSLTSLILSLCVNTVMDAIKAKKNDKPDISGVRAKLSID